MTLSRVHFSLHFQLLSFLFFSWDFVEKVMATHSSTLAWKIPWAEEPGGLQSMGSLGVGHDWENSLSLFTLMHWRRQWQPTPVFLPGESQERGAWWAAVYGVAHSRTRLQRLSSRSTSMRFWISSSVSSFFFFFRTNSLLTSLVSPPTVFPPSPRHSLASSPLKFPHFHIPTQLSTQPVLFLCLPSFMKMDNIQLAFRVKF